MNKIIKERWISALNSGEYKQGKGVLRSADNRYCCLGVLCDIYSKEHNVEWEQDGNYEILDNGYLLPKEVVLWSEMNTDVGAYDDSNYALTTDNDSGKTFDEIAKIIEKHF